MGVATVVVGSTLMTGLAESAVFEQTNSGKVIEVSSGTAFASKYRHRNLEKISYGFAAGTLRSNHWSLASANWLQDFDRDRAALATASAIVDTSIAGRELVDALADDYVIAGISRHFRSISSASATRQALDSASRSPGLSSLPSARKMTRALSSSQREMYWLAADFGSRFASVPGVRKSGINEAMFVNLFTAMIQRESNFDPRAVSSAGAVGLGQLMPATALDLGVRDRYSPRQNLEGAARYLAEMLEQFGSFELALAAYNAGPGNVRKYRGIPPYRETRQYVSDILHAVSDEPHNIALQVARTGSETPPALLAFVNSNSLDSGKQRSSKRAFEALLNPVSFPKKPRVTGPKSYRVGKITTAKRKEVSAQGAPSQRRSLIEWLRSRQDDAKDKNGK